MSLKTEKVLDSTVKYGIALEWREELLSDSSHVFNIYILYNGREIVSWNATSYMEASEIYDTLEGILSIMNIEVDTEREVYHD